MSIFEKSNLHHLKLSSWIRGAVSLCAAGTVLLSVTATSWADALTILTGVDDTAVVLKKDAYVSALAAKSVYASQEGNSYDVRLEDGTQTTIRHGDEVITITAQQERVASLLNRLHIEMTPLEMIQVDLSRPGCADITISEDLTYYDKEVSPAGYTTVRQPNPDLPEGTERVVQAGQDGERVSIYEVVWSGGELVSRQLVEEAVNNTVDQIVEYSTADAQAQRAADEAARAAQAYAAALEAAKAADAAKAAEEAAKAADAAKAAAEAAQAAKPVASAEAQESAATAAKAAEDAQSAVKEAEAAAAKKAEEEARKTEEARIAATQNLPMDHLVDVRKNADGSGVLVFQSGREVKYRYAKQMSATAYNKDEPGLGIWTASGTKVHKGVVAVDKRVIPLGTRLYVMANNYEYGYSVAEDTGVTGNTIDLYFESYRGMQNFGRRPATVYILE
ncbi:MAG: G5 domain-containing protein [Oscillibacter sp.]|nr:G5 domain-containing protein [Oscillibacter sp.]